MKKFAFLLAIVAVFAMSAAAWADVPDEAKWVKSLAPNTSGPINMGNFVQVTAPDKSPKTDGVYTADVYYFGTLSAAQKAEANIDLTVGSADQNQYYALPEGATFAEDEHKFGNKPSAGQNGREGVLELTSAAKAAYTFGVANSANNGLDDTVTRAKLTLKPVEVTFAASGVTDGKYTLKTDGTVKTISFTGAYGTSGAIASDKISFVVKSGDKTSAETLSDTPLNIIGNSTNGVAALYQNGEIRMRSVGTVADGQTATLTVMGASGGQEVTAGGPKVAGIDENTVIMTIDITTASYVVEPASAAWDGSTATEGVKFTVKDLTAEQISKIEIKASGIAPDVLDAANYTKTTKGKDVEIELKLEWLEGLSKNDYTFTITDGSNKTASFVLTVTPKSGGGDGDKGGEAVTPSPEEVDKAKAELAAIVPDSGITVRASKSEDIVIKTDLPSVDEQTGDFYRVRIESAPLANHGDAIAIGAKKIGTRLPDESTANGISFVKVFDAENGAGVVPLDEVCGYNASTGLYELNATVVIIDDAAPATKPAGFVPGAKDGEGVAIVKTDAGNFVYIWDGVKDGYARDPIFARETNGKSGSSGACDMGFGLVAVAGLAAIAIRRRGK